MNYTIGDKVKHIINKVSDKLYVVYKIKESASSTYFFTGRGVFDSEGKVEIDVTSKYKSKLKNNKLSSTQFDLYKSFQFTVFEDDETTEKYTLTDDVYNIYSEWFDDNNYNIDTTFAHIANYHTQTYIEGMKLNLLAYDDWSHWTTKNRLGDVYTAYNKKNPMIFATEIAMENLGSSMIVSNLKSPKLYFDKLYDTLTLECNGEDTNLGDDFGVGFVYEDESVTEWADMCTSCGDIVMTKSIYLGKKIKGLAFNFHTGGTENGVLNKLNVYIGDEVGDSFVVKDTNNYTFSTGVHTIDTSSMNIDNIQDYDSVSYMINYPTDAIIDSDDRERRIVNQVYDIDKLNVNCGYKLTWIGLDNLIYQFPFSGYDTNNVDYEHKYIYNVDNEQNKYQTNKTNSWTLNTKIITEDDIKLLESLNDSLDIELYSFKYDKTISVNTTSNTYKYKTYKNENNIFNLQINLKAKETKIIK